METSYCWDLESRKREKKIPTPPRIHEESLGALGNTKINISQNLHLETRLEFQDFPLFSYNHILLLSQKTNIE